MYIYSPAINTFRADCVNSLREILSRETDIKTRQSRFSLQGYHWPLKIICYQDEREKKQTMLGYFDNNSLTIYLNYTLVSHLNQTDLHNLLRHEMAHYLCFILYGNSIQHHGDEYRELCRKYHWNQEIWLSTMQVDAQHLTQKKKTYEKLLRLSQSHNLHEANLALEKSREYMLKYNLNQAYDNDDQWSYCHQVAQFTRKNTKLDCLYHIIQYFHVVPIFQYNSKIHFLELIGDRKQILHASEVFHFLDDFFEQSWAKEKKQAALKGARAKNSFFRGLRDGIITNLKKQKFSTQEKKQLIVIEKKLQRDLNLVCPRRSSSYSRHSNDRNANNIGFKLGQKTKLNNITSSVKRLFYAP